MSMTEHRSESSCYQRHPVFAGDHKEPLSLKFHLMDQLRHDRVGGQISQNIMVDKSYKTKVKVINCMDYYRKLAISTPELSPGQPGLLRTFGP